MPKMVCTECQCEFVILKNEVSVIEMFCDPPVPYKIWSADLWKCPGCGKEVVAGFSQSWVEHYQSRFQDELDRIMKSGATVIYDYEHPVSKQGLKTAEQNNT
jgi:hypothetical protein